MPYYKAIYAGHRVVSVKETQNTMVHIEVREDGSLIHAIVLAESIEDAERKATEMADKQQKATGEDE